MRGVRSLVAVAVIALGLSACTVAAFTAAGGAGAAAGALATVEAVNTDANTALAIVKPINQAACLLEPWSPKSDEAKAAIQAFCSHLPDDTTGLAVQIFAVIAAVDAAHDKAKEPVANDQH